MTRAADPPPDAEPLGLRERGKRARTNRILDAGLELLREEPGQNLTVERIAERADVAPMTVYNLVGTRSQMWTALADRALQGVELRSISADGPQERARRIVDAFTRVLRQDAQVFTVLLAGWSGGVLLHDPTALFIECLTEAVDRGEVDPGAHLRRHGEVMAAGLLGTIHQWTAGLLSDRAFAARARAVVDIVFASARHPDEKPADH